MVCGSWQVPWPSRSPWMSSMSDSSTTSSGDELVARTLKATGPPGSGNSVGLAVLTTPMVGSTSVRVTDASASSMTVLPSSSLASAVIVSVRRSPALPVTGPWNEHV